MLSTVCRVLNTFFSFVYDGLDYLLFISSKIGEILATSILFVIKSFNDITLLYKTPIMFILKLKDLLLEEYDQMGVTSKVVALSFFYLVLEFTILADLRQAMIKFFKIFVSFTILLFSAVTMPIKLLIRHYKIAPATVNVAVETDPPYRRRPLTRSTGTDTEADTEDSNQEISVVNQWLNKFNINFLVNNSLCCFRKVRNTIQYHRDNVTRTLRGTLFRPRNLERLNLSQKNNLSKCRLCMERDTNVALLPCGHLYLCESCAEQLITYDDRCSVCRAQFTDKIKIYFS